MSGSFICSNTAKTIDGFTIYVGGSFTNAVDTSGTTTIVLNGTGIISGAGLLQNSLTINTLNPGGITFPAANFNYNTGTLWHINGIVVTTGNTLVVATSTTFNTATMVWNNITFTAGTLTLLSTLRANKFTASGVAVFAGTAGFVITEVSFGAGLHFTPGLPYRVTTIFGSTGAGEIKSLVSGTRATFILDAGATCTLGFITVTDIDASGGRTINIFMGTVINSINVNAYGDPVRTIAKSFVS
jgi:hypothetical protein